LSAEVAEAIHVGVGLVGVRHRGAVVTYVTDTVTVAVGLVPFARNLQLSLLLSTPSPSASPRGLAGSPGFR